MRDEDVIRLFTESTSLIAGVMTSMTYFGIAADC